MTIHSQNNIAVSRSEGEIQFGQLLRFHLEATAPADIVSIQIAFEADPMVDRFVKDVTEFMPAPTVALSTTIPLIEFPRLRPFTTLTYQWILQDAAGNQHETPPATMTYQDNRLNWQSLTRDRDNITIYWADGDNTLARTALAVIDEVQGEMLGIVPAFPLQNLQIYLYPSYSDLRATMQLAGYNWVAGQAIPEFDAIAIALPDQTTAAVELRRTLPHELSHLLLYQATEDYYDDAPIWLDEGLATFFEAEVNPNQVAVLDRAVNAGTTIPLDQLCLRFPSDEQSALLAYAQSRSLVAYIQQRYGNQALTQMANVIADGAGCEATVLRVLGISSLQLEQEWLNSLRQQPFWQSFFGDNRLLWLFVLGGAGFLVLLWFEPCKN